MKICVAGGSLQGIEATYLAKKAGYEVILIDKDPEVPAATLADEFHPLDLVKDVDVVKETLSTVDAVLPATENKKTLRFLEGLSLEKGIPFMQDNSAFWISSNKIKSIDLFASLNIPYPKPWPDSGFPVIVKPAGRSGSVGACRADNEEQLKYALKRTRSIDKEVIVQEFIDGPALSLEVIAFNCDPIPLQITQLEFDEAYGCKGVFTPDLVGDHARESFMEFSKRIAKKLNLKGLMDTQAIVNGNDIPVMIEINARLPSQTPTVVYHSSGINMVGLLVEMFVKNKIPRVSVKPNSSVVYQHIRVDDNSVIQIGEHIMSEARNLRNERNFFGADEAITNLNVTGLGGVATLIVKGPSLEKARAKMMQVVEEITANFTQ